MKSPRKWRGASAEPAPATPRMSQRQINDWIRKREREIAEEKAAADRLGTAPPEDEFGS